MFIEDARVDAVVSMVVVFDVMNFLEHELFVLLVFFGAFETALSLLKENSTSTWDAFSIVLPNSVVSKVFLEVFFNI